MTVLFVVAPLHGLTHTASGLDLLDDLSSEGAEDDGLARHGYVLMSANPEQALAGAEKLPPNLRILAKPFRLEELRARMEAVTERLFTRTIPQSYGVQDNTLRIIGVSRQLMKEARDRLQRHTGRRGEDAPDT
jgi:hypothetical protein